MTQKADYEETLLFEGFAREPAADLVARWCLNDAPNAPRHVEWINKPEGMFKLVNGAATYRVRLPEGSAVFAIYRVSY